jgi:hypothetical protein
MKDKPALAVQLGLGQLFPATGPPSLVAMRPEPVHDPSVESVEQPSNVGTFVIFAPTPQVSLLFLTIFAGCLPRPTSDRRLPGHATFASLQVLFSRPTTDRALLTVSLTLIDSLTPMPLADPASPPEVTRCSSLPCRPQTPWCGG